MTGAPSLRVVVIAPLRFPIRRPHAGGLESAVWNEVSQLRRRGHDVTLIAVEGSDYLGSDEAFSIPSMAWPDRARPTDDTYPDSYHTRSVPALGRALDVIAAHPGNYDVVSNHCLHGLPLERAGELGLPMITTLHTPVDRHLVDSHQRATGRQSEFLSVSEHTRLQWESVGIASTVLPNAVDPEIWRLGPGGRDLVWFGRIVPEKAPHLAIEVARRLGRTLVIAGRIGDATYAERHLLPALGGDVHYAGQLSPAQLARLVGRSACSIATPVWEEPFGLVAPEALMCGTPVASFDVGGVAEIAAASPGMATAAPNDTSGLADRAAELIEQTERDTEFRRDIRAAARAGFSLQTRTALLEGHFRALVAQPGEAQDQAA